MTRRAIPLARIEALADLAARTGQQITSTRALGRFRCEREWPARPDLSARQCWQRQAGSASNRRS